MMKIMLTQGKAALVDDEDYERVKCLKWHAKYDKKGNRYYVKHNYIEGGKYKHYMMHRYILDAPRSWLVDHINGNPLDNRRSNLRLATPSQNQGNSRQTAGRSGYRGVTITPHGKYHAQIGINGTRTHLGNFSDPGVAAETYDRAALAHFGKFATLNFPIERYAVAQNQLLRSA